MISGGLVFFALEGTVAVGLPKPTSVCSSGAPPQPPPPTDLWFNFIYSRTLTLANVPRAPGHAIQWCQIYNHQRWKLCFIVSANVILIKIVISVNAAMHRIRNGGCACFLCVRAQRSVRGRAMPDRAISSCTNGGTSRRRASAAHFCGADARATQRIVSARTQSACTTVWASRVNVEFAYYTYSCRG